MTRIAINGFGRIGRCVLRALEQRQGHGLEVVAINDLTDAKTLAHLLKYDSVHGTFAGTVSHGEGKITVNGRDIRITAERDPAKLGWKDQNVELVVESSGVFTDGPKAKGHLDAGAKRVLISAPGKNVDATFAMGVNHTSYDKTKHFIFSNASCTTNCLAPVAKVLDESFGIVSGLMTTVHSVTNDQQILDLPHKDLRRARAAFESMIPTSTGAAKALGEVLPSMQGKLNGFAVRVPTKNVSMVDLTVNVAKDVTKEEVNKALTEAANGPLKGVLAVTTEELVSCDFNGDAHSSTVDSLLTEVLQKRMVKVVAWYDNEWGYSNRVVDLAAYVIKNS
ncbi:MAG: type I glyceraldehyde-3-phosphate dehydrogenase [Deltaproteobacteria bacterium]|nr:type I glyceraldehyde-3-phosphate dehydrogenase [Deltaproteobacteria bacterium]